MLDFIYLAQTRVPADEIHWEIFKAVVPVVVSLAGAVGVLWKAVYKQMNDTKEELITNKAELSAKLDQCEAKHKEQHEWAVSMSEKVGRLEGQMEGHTQAREDLRELSSAVIDLLHNS